MRILQIIPLADSFRVFLSELTSELLADGHEVLTVFNPTGGVADQQVDGPGQIRHLGFSRGANIFKHLSTANCVSEIVSDFQPHVVHAHFSASILTAALARRRTPKPCCWIGTFQGLQFPLTPGLRGKCIRIAETLASSRLDQTWVLTEDDYQAFQESTFKGNVRIQHTLGFGCHDRFFDTPRLSDADQAALKKSVGISIGSILLIFIGRLVAFKGFHLAARAFLRVSEFRPELHWLIIGEPDPIHPTGLSEDELKALKEHPNVHWLGIQDNVLPWLDCSDAMLFPTSREGMPVSVMEALARRVPVLTNPVRGCRELITEGGNGHFFQAVSVDAISETLSNFQPFVASEPNERTRRSKWIEETRALYQSVRN